VCVGRLVATKNQRLVVDALAGLPAEERSGIGVLLVGDGPAADELRQQIASHGLEDHVHLTGPVPRDEVPDLLASADFGVFPTITEASSLAAAEAMAAGLPILCLDIPSMAETVGDGGILSSPESFAADLVRMAREHPGFAPAARARAERCRVDVVRGTWTERYRSAASGRRQA
jgi:alpha-1,3-rhamnosyl/mannosyltransferase